MLQHHGHGANASRDIIMWLVKWTLPFSRATSMPVDFALDDMQLPDQNQVERHQIQLWCACLHPSFHQYQAILLGNRDTWV